MANRWQAGGEQQVGLQPQVFCQFVYRLSERLNLNVRVHVFGSADVGVPQNILDVLYRDPSRSCQGREGVAESVEADMFKTLLF